MLAFQESPDRGHHPLGLLVGQLGIDRQGEGLAGRGFARGEIARAMAEIGETLLQVQRDG